MVEVGVVIVAGGSGLRMKSGLPKQFLPLYGDATVLEVTLRRFMQALPGSEIVVVLPVSEIVRWEGICRGRELVGTHRICSGGSTRFESVRNGIESLGECRLIAVHDGVRPLASDDLIRRCVAAASVAGAAIPVVRPVDSFREVDGDRNSIVDRERLRAVQTPQVFDAELLRRAYGSDYRSEFTDDASVAEAAGAAITLCDGERMNIKITTPEDMAVARLFMMKLAGDGVDDICGGDFDARRL